MVKFSYQGLFKSLFVFYSLVAALSVLAHSTSLIYAVVCMFAFLLVLLVLQKRAVNVSALVVFFILTSASILLFYNKTATVGSVFPFFFFLYLVCFYLYFKMNSGVRSGDFLNVINYCYWVYVLISLFCYFFMSHYYRAIYLPGFSFRAFHGIEGTPANIDSFSTFVILVNYFFNRSKSRFSLYGLALLVMFFSGAVTPVLIFLVVILSALYLRIFKSFSSLVILFSITHILMLYFSYTSEFVSDLLMLATNGRNFIWDAQLANMTSHSILWSDVEAATVSINWSDGETNNPHNAFLFSVLRIGGLCSLLLFLSFFIKSRKATYHNQLLLMAFLAAGISNSNMLYIGNPIYFYMVFFALFYRGEKSV